MEGGTFEGWATSHTEVEAWGSVAEDGHQPVGILGKCKTWGRDGDNKGEITSLKL